MIHIVDYGMGNIGSVANMLKKLGIPATIASDPSAAAAAAKAILPGVGAFDHGMANLAERGWLPVLQRWREDGVPVLGICLGMQLMTRRSEEGQRPGLGWFAADTVRFRTGPAGEGRPLRIPHMGWNDVRPTRDHPLLRGDGLRFYFVHSYHVRCDDERDVIATAEHGAPFACAIARERVVGVQFHPEKSHAFGMALLRAFAEAP